MKSLSHLCSLVTGRKGNLSNCRIDPAELITPPKSSQLAANAAPRRFQRQTTIKGTYANPATQKTVGIEFLQRWDRPCIRDKTSLVLPKDFRRAQTAVISLCLYRCPIPHRCSAFLTASWKSLAPSGGADIEKPSGRKYIFRSLLAIDYAIVTNIFTRNIITPYSSSNTGQVPHP